VGLRHDAAGVGRLHLVEHLGGPESEAREPVGAKPHGHAGPAGHRSYAYVDGLAHALERGSHVVRPRVEQTEIVAEEVHHHLGHVAGDPLADAVAEERQHLGLDAGNAGEQRADLLGGGSLLAATDLLRDRGDGRQLEQRPR
jgi:hypothetical protein